MSQAIMRRALPKFRTLIPPPSSFSAPKAPLADCTGKCGGKVALIIGPSSGVAFVCANTLLESGAKGVMLGDVDKEQGEKSIWKLARNFGDKAAFTPTEFTEKEQLQKLFGAVVEKFGQLDIVINNIADGEKKEQIDLNLGVMMGNILAFDYMGVHKGGRGGVVVNVGCYTHLPNSAAISWSAKHFFVGVSQLLGEKHYENLTGVKILTICHNTSHRKGTRNFAASLLVTLQTCENGSVWLSKDDKCSRINLQPTSSPQPCISPK